MSLQNHFSLFDLPLKFNIDLSELTARYRDLQKVVHPDNFSNSSEQERLHAIKQAAQVNDAFTVLKSPLLRAQYLLEHNGVEPESNATISDPAFLMQQMEMRELLEAATEKNDALTAVEDVLDEIDELYRSLIQKITTMFAETSPDFVAVNEQVLKLHFFSRLKNEAEEKLAIIENK